MPPQFLPMPPHIQAGPSFYPPPILVLQNLPSIISAHPNALRVQVTLIALDVSHQDPTNFNNIPPNPGDPQGRMFPEISGLPTSASVQLDPIPSPPPPGDTAGLSAAPPLLHKLFEHDIDKLMVFFVPITLRKWGKIVEIFRVNFQPLSTGWPSYRNLFSRSLGVNL